MGCVWRQFNSARPDQRMKKIEISIIQGTEEIVLKKIDQKYNPVVKIHPNISIITINGDYIASDFDYLKCSLSVTDQQTAIKLDHRDWRVAKVAAGINPALAEIMCELAEIKDGDVILDPFCGAGVIPISALLNHKAQTAIAADIDGFATNCTRKNGLAAGLGKELIVITSDIAKLILGNQSIDSIISNLPFGIRTGSHKENIYSYQALSKKAKLWLKPNRKIVLLSQEINLVKETFADYKLVRDLPIYHRGINPHIFIYQLT